jgi:hypothetical protein
MNPGSPPEGPLLVVVSVDPETSHRANEAVRIALGLLASENELAIALVGLGAKILSADVEDYVDGEDLVRHLGTFRKLGQPLHVERGAISGDPAWNPTAVTIAPLEPGDLAALATRSRRVLVF